MKLYIKTTEFEDGHKEYELMKKHEFKIFGKTLTWYTKYYERSVKSELHYSGRYFIGEHHLNVLRYQHHIYTKKEDIECAKKDFEIGQIEYMGFHIIPTHSTNYLGERLYYIPSDSNYRIENGFDLVLWGSTYDTLKSCKREVKEICDKNEMKRKKTTKVKSTIK